jgi:hypothetical protein
MKNTAKNTATKNTLATAAKAAAKAPKSDAPKTKLELFGEALNKYVRAHFDCVEKKDGKVYLRKVDLGKGPVDYRVELTACAAKEGKRATQKRNLYRITPEGKELLVQFGTFKKKYLYPLMNMVIAGKLPKSGKMVVDAELTKKIAAAIRADRKAFTLDKGVLAGRVKDVGAIRMVETKRTLKTGKVQLERQLFIDGVLKLEGGQLGRIKNAFTKVGAHKTMKDIMAEAEATVSDLI